MDLLQSLQGILGGIGGQGNQSQQGGGGQTAGFDLQKLLGPAALGGLAGALFGGGKSSLGGMLKGALLVGGGKMLWDKYKDMIRGANTTTQQQNKAPAMASQRAERMIRALVYAARADGHIDEQEQAAISEQMGQMNLGVEGQDIVRQAMTEALDPARIAAGVSDEEEVLQLFTVSCAVLNIDNFMERSYLDGLAAALGIPSQVKDDIMAKLKT